MTVHTIRPEDRDQLRGRILFWTGLDPSREDARETLEEAGYETETGVTAEDVRRHLGSALFDVVVTRLEPTTAVERLAVIREEDGEVEVVGLVAGDEELPEEADRAILPGRTVELGEPSFPSVVREAADRRRLRDMALLFRRSQELFRTPFGDDLPDRIVASVIETIRADQASLMLSESGDRLRLVAHEGMTTADPTRDLEIGERVAGQAALRREPLLIVGSVADDPGFMDLTPRPEIGSAIVHPLVVDDRLIGVVNIARRPDAIPFGRADIPRVGLFLSQVALALENRRLYDELAARVADLETYQARAVRSEKLAATGALVAGLAHELNNPLTSIQGFVQLLLEGRAADDSIREDLEIVLEETKRCQDIIGSLMRFARDRRLAGQRPRRCVSLAAVCREVLEEHEPGLEAMGIRVERDLADDLPPILGDEVALKQAVRHLVRNAELAAAEAEEGDRLVRVTGRRSSGRLVLEVSDSGPGIPPELRGRVLDPFFTTRPVGQGAGLGLAVVYGVVEDLGGEIDIDDAPEGGARVRVVVPIREPGDPEEDEGG